MKNILVAISFDDRVREIIDHAAKIAKAFKANIWLLHIAQADPDFVGFEVGPQYVRDGRAVKLKEERLKIQGLSDELKTEGINAHGLVIKGATVEMILEEAEKLNIDMIVMGHEKQNFLYRALFGSVSKMVSKKTKIPILIIPSLG